ncbi:hypothetical protein NliqN6_1741 [Naganishia liquefaciens]|uniref:Ribonuclease H n=1 Tax=Naganishia liquefaciens TaxID=104408 RepID=A0A8H3TSB1_9TREE|nr:hypothetical protein NliqN6_1741 [Naganishia liquefaciens]
MKNASRLVIPIINCSRPFSSSVRQAVTNIPIRLPQNLPAQCTFLQRFQISLRVDPEHIAVDREGKASTDRTEKMPKTVFYAVKAGRKPGIYDTWAECEGQTKGYTGAIFKKFPTRTAAEEFIGRGSVVTQPYSVAAQEPKTKSAKKSSKGYYAVKSGLKPGIYNDWSEVEPLVRGIQGAIYKRFPTREAAQEFMSGSNTPTTVKSFNDIPGVEKVNNRFELEPALTATIAHNATSTDLNHHRQVARSQGFTVTSGPSGALVVYTDGSSRGNGQHGASAGSGIWWADKGHAKTLNLAERLPGSLQTNNRGELLAIIRALESCPFPQLPLEIRTDSQYSISCITKYLPSWIRNGFRSSTGQPVKNKDMIVHLLALLNTRGKNNAVKFVHVKAHRGEIGNEGADMLANAGAAMQSVPERTHWFSLEDANRFTAEQREATKLVGSSGQGAHVHKKVAPNDSIQSLEANGARIDVLPVEVEVDPSWLLTEEEMAELETDQQSAP